MKNSYFCTSCGGFFEKVTSEEEALREAEAKFGPIEPLERSIVCDPCFRWMEDVERIARRLAGQAGHDPDHFIRMKDGPHPMWTRFIPEARGLTTKKPPIGMPR